MNYNLPLQGSPGLSFGGSPAALSESNVSSFVVCKFALFTNEKSLPILQFVIFKFVIILPILQAPWHFPNACPPPWKWKQNRQSKASQKSSTSEYMKDTFKCIVKSYIHSQAVPSLSFCLKAKYFLYYNLKKYFLYYNLYSPIKATVSESFILMRAKIVLRIQYGSAADQLKW